MSIKTQELEKKTLTRQQVAKAMCKDLFSHSVVRVVEICEKMQPPPDDTTIKRMLRKRFGIAVEATEIFLDSWETMGKGRFLTKED